MSDPKFPNYKECGQILSEKQILDLLEILNIDYQKFSDAKVYTDLTKDNIIDKSLRDVVHVKYDDKRLFEYINNNLISKLNKMEQNHEFYLINNQIELIKYNKGNFFKRHQDYIYIESNEFTEYTFIICIEQCTKGGETKFYIKKGDKEEEKDILLKRGEVIIFKKNIPHEGLPVENGNKIIVCGNILCFAKINL